MESENLVTLTIRLIRSFEHRNIKNVVFHNIDLNISAQSFQEMIKKDISTRSGLPPPFKKYEYDTLKIEHHAHGAKSNDPVINRENDEKLILQPIVTLKEAGIANETEISFFKKEDYLKYKENPHTLW